MYACLLQIFRNHGWDGKTNASDPSTRGRGAAGATPAGEYDEDLGEWVAPGDASGDLEHDDSRCLPANVPYGPPPASPSPHHHDHHHGKHGSHHGHGHSSKSDHHHHGSKEHHKDDHHHGKHGHGHDHHHDIQLQPQHEDAAAAADTASQQTGGWRWWVRPVQDSQYRAPEHQKRQQQQQLWSDEVSTIVEM
jgi:hypothetical protein